MSIGGQFREFGRFLDECEKGPWVIERVDVDEHLARDGDLTADVAVVHAPGDDGDDSDAGRTVSLGSPRVDPDGTLRFALQDAETLVPSREFDLEVDPTGATVEAYGTITTTLRASVPAADDGSIETDRRCDDHRSGQNGQRESGRTASGEDELAQAESGESAESSAGRSGGRDLPPFKDPELLRSIFQSHDTFAEMAEAIDMDVTAETVRRYMIDYDIHQPKRYKTGSGRTSADADGDETERRAKRDAEGEAEGDAEGEAELDTGSGSQSGIDVEREAESVDGAGDATGSTPGETATPDEPVVLSDGIGLPEDVTVETLIDTVKRSNTIYEVTRDIDIDREHALQMLEELNLLDLVVGRLATEGERDLEREEIVERLRQASAAA